MVLKINSIVKLLIFAEFNELITQKIYDYREYYEKKERLVIKFYKYILEIS